MDFTDDDRMNQGLTARDSKKNPDGVSSLLSTTPLNMIIDTTNIGSMIVQLASIFLFILMVGGAVIAAMPLINQFFIRAWIIVIYYALLVVLVTMITLVNMRYHGTYAFVRIFGGRIDADHTMLKDDVYGLEVAVVPMIVLITMLVFASIAQYRYPDISTIEEYFAQLSTPVGLHFTLLYLGTFFFMMVYSSMQIIVHYGNTLYRAGRFLLDATIIAGRVDGTFTLKRTMNKMFPQASAYHMTKRESEVSKKD